MGKKKLENLCWEESRLPACSLLALTTLREYLVVLRHGSTKGSPTERIMKAQSSQETHIYCIILLILKASCSRIKYLLNTVSFAKNQGQFQETQSGCRCLNNTTYSELWSDQGSWFLWPVVFAITLWTTVVWPDRQPSRNTGKTKIPIVSKTHHTEVTHLPLRVDEGCSCLLSRAETELQIQLINC